MEEFFSSFLRRAGMPASAGLSCYLCGRWNLITNWYQYWPSGSRNVTILTIQGHVTSSVSWIFDSQVVISYRYCTPLAPSPYLQPLSRYWVPNILGSWHWPFWVTWHHQSRDHLNLNGPFPIGGPLDPSLYIQPFSRYLALSILGSRPRPFWVTWHHRSRDHPNPR